MLFIDKETARRLETTLAVANAATATAEARLRPATGAAAEPFAGGQAIYCGLESPLTQVLGIGLDGPVTAEEMDRLEEFYRSRGSKVRVVLCPFADPSILEHMKARGYHLEEFENALVQPLEGRVFKPAPSPGVEVRQAHKEEADRWVRTVVRGFLEGGELLQVYLDCLESNFHASTSTCFIATVDGEPVGGGAVTIHDGIALTNGASTLPEFRNRGIQTALLQARLAYAIERGCDLAMVMTKPGSVSQRNVERQGFSLAYTYAVMTREWR